MAYNGNSVWGPSYYDSNNFNNSSWQGTNPAYSQHETYNPVYPSYDGSSSFFSSSTHQALQYAAAPYQPTKTTVPTPIPRVSVQRRNRGHRNRKSGTEKAVPPQKFRLVTVNPDVAGTAKLPENVVESAPTSQSKVAPATNTKSSNKPRGKRGGQKMPNYRGLQGNGWEPSGYQRAGGYPAQRGGRGGGRGGHRGGKNQGPPRPSNTKDDIPFVPMADEAPAISLAVSSENIIAFHGFDSVFTTQHNFPVFIDNKIYTSCDHYYQIRKVTDLTGVSSEKLDCSVRDENGKPIIEVTDKDQKEKKAHSSIAREILKASSISKEKVDEWRYSKGLEAIQKALEAKVSQSAHLREALRESRDQILVHAYPRDSIYGTGCGVPQIKKWLEDLAKAGVKTLKVPATFPLDQDTVQNCPVFAQGRNILGVILMQLREKVCKSEIDVKDMTDVYKALRVDGTAESSKPVDTDFTMDNQTLGTF